MTYVLWMIPALFLLLPHRAEAREMEHIIRCESSGFAPAQCRLPLAPRNAEIKEIRMVRQHSTKPCIEGKSWEAGYEGITVTNGCRADFRIVYEIIADNRPDRYDRRDRHRHDRDDYRDGERWDQGPDFHREDPTEIVRRAFREILHRPPTREELREFRYLITRQDWSERDIRRELRRRSYENNHY